MHAPGEGIAPLGHWKMPTDVQCVRQTPRMDAASENGPGGTNGVGVESSASDVGHRAWVGKREPASSCVDGNRGHESRSETLWMNWPLNVQLDEVRFIGIDEETELLRDGTPHHDARTTQEEVERRSVAFRVADAGGTARASGRATGARSRTVGAGCGHLERRLNQRADVDQNALLLVLDHWHGGSDAGNEKRTDQSD